MGATSLCERLGRWVMAGVTGDESRRKSMAAVMLFSLLPLALVSLNAWTIRWGSRQPSS